jgi:hypothetical protein
MTLFLFQVSFFKHKMLCRRRLACLCRRYSISTARDEPKKANLTLKKDKFGLFRRYSISTAKDEPKKANLAYKKERQAKLENSITYPAGFTGGKILEAILIFVPSSQNDLKKCHALRVAFFRRYYSAHRNQKFHYELTVHELLHVANFEFYLYFLAFRFVSFLTN